MRTIRLLFKTALITASLAISSIPLFSQAATATVLVGSGGLRFVPAVTNINVGDQVTWMWSASGHSTTSGTVSGGTGNPNGLWDSGVNSTPFSFSHTFGSAGTFPYFCTPHAGLNMTGAVVVAAANLPPAVSITNPVSGAIFAAPANVTIRASASDSDGTVTNVHFLIGTTNLGNVTVAPYSIATGSLNAGSYTLSAVASDNSGATATNSVSINVVTPVTVSLSAPLMLPPGKFKFSYTANSGLDYIIQRTTNLPSPNWIPLATNTAASGSINFTDLNATLDGAFYRVGRLPNP